MLKKIVLKNFMCHDNFEITLNPRVNFITGQNGSGKSAIVAALMVGFGQRATVTNRAQSVKDFIKRGRHSAVLEITLSNDGENSFEYEEYGDEITVIRKITESSSTYSLRDSQGKSHPCNAKVLNALLLHFSIQPNNPLCILSQDVARTFLQKFDPRSLYNLYTQATLSKTINESFADSQDTLKKTQLQLERKKKDIETLSQEVHDAEKRKQMAEKYRYLIERQEEVKNELVWSKIKALEDAAQKKETTQMEIDSERDKILHKIKNSSEDALKTKLKELQVELDQSQDKLGKLESQQHREKDALNNVKEELSILKQHFKEIEQQIQRKDREIKQLEEASNKVLNVNVPEIQKQKKELQSLMAKIQELEAAKRNSELHLTHLRDTYENSSLKLENLTSAMAPVKNQISDSRRKVDAFKKGKSLAIYGGWMPEFINEINNAFDRGRFFKKPKGPIGSYLQVIDSQWAPAIEEILKYQLSVFCLNSAADNKVFNEIAEKCIPRNKIPSTSTSKFLFSAYNYSTNEVRHPKYSSLIGQLKCSDPDILNCLIDEMSIEQILLVPDLTIACQLCEERGNAPTNLRYCVTKEADKVFPAPNYKFFASRKRSMVANFLQVNPAQHLTYLEKTIEESQETLYSLQNEKKMTEESNLSVKNDIVETQQTLGVLRQQLKHFNEKKSEVETTIFEPVSVDLYRKDIEMCLSEKEKALQKKEAIVNKITKAEILIDECIKNVKNVSEALRPIFEEKNKILHLIDCTEKDLRDKERLGTKLRAHFHSLTEKEKALREELQKIRKSIQEKTEKAQNAASEIEEVRDLPVVEEELKKVKDDLLGLKNFCEENTIEIAEQEFLDKKKLLVQSKRFMNRFEKLADMTSKKLDEDLKLININEQRQLSVAKALFSEVLKERDLQGTFNLDNHNQILKMHVVRGKEKATGKKGEISSLSGGEKSFTTIAFIIAVWESMTVPFFVMDEFDVFTDVITRNTILKMLSEYALQNSAQFIFLTPHDLSRIDTNRDDVAVHRINNPRA